MCHGLKLLVVVEAVVEFDGTLEPRDGEGGEGDIPPPA